MNETWFEQLAVQALNTPPFPNPNFPPSPYYQFLRLLAANMKSNLSVELGVSGGGGSLHLAMGNPDGTVIGVDFAWDNPENIGFIQNRYPNFIFMRKDSIEAAPAIFKEYGKIDILFIDTTHTYDQTLSEFNAYRDYLSDNFVVCVDDLFRPGMKEAWADLPGRKVRLDRLHTGAASGGGFGVIWQEI